MIFSGRTPADVTLRHSRGSFLEINESRCFCVPLTNRVSAPRDVGPIGRLVCTAQCPPPHTTGQEDGMIVTNMAHPQRKWARTPDGHFTAQARLHVTTGYTSILGNSALGPRQVFQQAAQLP